MAPCTVNMYAIKLILCFVSLCVVVNAYVAIARPEKKPEKYADQEGCYSSQYDQVLQYNVPFTPTDGSCQRYTCARNNETHIAGCGAVYISDGCETAEGDKSLPYPKCCSGVKCKKEDGTYVYDFPY